jgi:hypothetical protein
MYNLKINPELLKYLNDTKNKSINRMCETQKYALLDSGEFPSPTIPHDLSKIIFIGLISFLAGSYFSFSYACK